MELAKFAYLKKYLQFLPQSFPLYFSHYDVEHLLNKHQFELKWY